MSRTFEDIGSDTQTAQDATAMIYVTGFENSDAVGFDLSDTIQTVHGGEVYQSLKDFVFSLPLNVSEIEEYRKTRTQVRKSAPKEEALQAEPDETAETARKKLLGESIAATFESIAATFKIAGIEGDCYRYRQYKAEEEKGKGDDRLKRKKYYDWLDCQLFLLKVIIPLIRNANIPQLSPTLQPPLDDEIPLSSPPLSSSLSSVMNFRTPASVHSSPSADFWTLIS